MRKLFHHQLYTSFENSEDCVCRHTQVYIMHVRGILLWSNGYFFVINSYKQFGEHKKFACQSRSEIVEYEEREFRRFFIPNFTGNLDAILLFNDGVFFGWHR